MDNIYHTRRIMVLLSYRYIYASLLAFDLNANSASKSRVAFVTFFRQFATCLLEEKLVKLKRRIRWDKKSAFYKRWSIKRSRICSWAERTKPKWKNTVFSITLEIKNQEETFSDLQELKNSIGNQSKFQHSSEQKHI